MVHLLWTKHRRHTHTHTHDTLYTHPLCSLVPVKHANKNPACLLIEVAPVVVDKGLTQLCSIDKARPVLVYSLQSQQTGRWND